MVKRSEIQSMSIDRLVQRFVEIGEKQDHSLLMDRFAEFNRLYKEKATVVEELKAREGNQRRALLRLYDHPNMQVRLNAVKATLAVAPQQARLALKSIADSHHYPQAGEAGMSIINLDRGIFKPT